MTHDEMIAVIQAHKDGKTIEARSSSRVGWTTLDDCDPSWNFEYNEYRVKPEPREWWGAISHGDPYPSLWSCRSDALDCAARRDGKVIKVREVL